MAETSPVSEPFSTPGQQRDAAMLGMYIFLGSEIMLFGGLFAVAATIRILHGHEIVDASKSLHYMIGAFNTAILLTSSLLVALGVEAAEKGRAGRAVFMIFSSACLGLGFLGMKASEYTAEYREGLLPLSGAITRFQTDAQHLFMDLYLIATGLHAIHLAIGVIVLSVVAARSATGGLRLPERSIVFVTVGLYWHLVDIVWVFLYPVFYLAR